MNVEKLADELNTALWLSKGDSGMAWLAVARRAMELLGDKPVATREAVMSRLDAMPNRTTWNANTVTQIMDALAHFAPPRTMIQGMSEMEIGQAMRAEMPPDLGEWSVGDCARVAHRLANTPAPEVDPDAGAKAAAWAWHVAYNKSCNGNGPDKNADELWRTMTEDCRNGWRAVAAMEKNNACV